MNIKKALFPATFDPIHLGHVDVIETASKIFDEVFVCSLINNNKIHTFGCDERDKMIELCCKQFKNVKMMRYNSLAVVAAVEIKAGFMIRGIRNGVDCENEMNLAFNNRILNNDIETIFIPSKQEHIHISSSGVKELLAFSIEPKTKIDFSKYLPECIMPVIIKALNLE